jgi:hypothetical protein
VSAERTNRRTWIVVGGIVAAIVVVNLLLAGIGRLTRGPSGPDSSSYSTTARGLAAYAELLQRSGHRVERVRDLPGERELDPRSTVVIADPGYLSASDDDALLTFLKRGGRLVAAGLDDSSVQTLLGGSRPAAASGAPTTSHAIAPVLEISRVSTVRTQGRHAWRSTGPALPVLGDRGRTLLAVVQTGNGRGLLLADSSPLQNGLLDEADNAVLALALAGPRSRTVAFVESVHGYGRAIGLAAVPTRWWWALGGAVLGSLLYMLARGRRLGPPQLDARPLPPPRRLYVDSLANVLARTKTPAAAVAPLQAEIRRRLAHDPHALEDPEIAAALHGDLLTAGRVLSRLAGRAAT